MSQENAEVVRRFYEAFGEGDLDAATTVFADQVRVTDPDLGTVEGLRAFRDYLEGLKGPLPDAAAMIERTYEAGDTVIVEGRFTGTNTGPLEGPEGEMPPSGPKSICRSPTSRGSARARSSNTEPITTRWPSLPSSA